MSQQTFTIKNLILIHSLAAILAFGCKKDKKENPIAVEKFTKKEVNIGVTLPEGTPYDLSSMKVSSLLTDGASLSNSESKVEIINEGGFETAFVANQNGNIILINMFTTSGNDKVAINSLTTAQSLVLLHPSGINLTSAGQLNAIKHIETLSEFTTLKLEIETAIKSGNINPLVSKRVTDAIVAVQLKAFTQIPKVTSYSQEIDPLTFNADGDKVIITNSKSSSTAYGINIYNDLGKFVVPVLCAGIPKSEFFTSGVSRAELKIPSQGTWNVKAKNGLAFDGSTENKLAAFENSKILAADIFGVFSKPLKEILIKNECLRTTLGEFIFNGLYTNFTAYNDGNMTEEELHLTIMAFFSQKYLDILSVIEDCVEKDADKYGFLIKSAPVKKLLEFVDVISRLTSVFNASAFLTDWLQYDTELDFCFIKTADGKIAQCPADDGVKKLLISGSPWYTDLDGERGKNDNIYQVVKFNADGTGIRGNSGPKGNGDYEVYRLFEWKYEGNGDITTYNTRSTTGELIGNGICSFIIENVTSTGFKNRDRQGNCQYVIVPGIYSRSSAGM